MNLISSDQIPKLNISTRKNVFKCQKSTFYVSGLNKVHKNYEKTVFGKFIVTSSLQMRISYVLLNIFEVAREPISLIGPSAPDFCALIGRAKNTFQD